MSYEKKQAAWLGAVATLYRSPPPTLCHATEQFAAISTVSGKSAVGFPCDWKGAVTIMPDSHRPDETPSDIFVASVRAV